MTAGLEFGDGLSLRLGQRPIGVLQDSPAQSLGQAGGLRLPAANGTSALVKVCTMWNQSTVTDALGVRSSRLVAASKATWAQIDRLV